MARRVAIVGCLIAAVVLAVLGQTGIAALLFLIALGLGTFSNGGPRAGGSGDGGDDGRGWFTSSYSDSSSHHHGGGGGHHGGGHDGGGGGHGW